MYYVRYLCFGVVKIVLFFSVDTCSFSFSPVYTPLLCCTDQQEDISYPALHTVHTYHTRFGGLVHTVHHTQGMFPHHITGRYRTRSTPNDYLGRLNKIFGYFFYELIIIIGWKACSRSSSLASASTPLEGASTVKEEVPLNLLLRR